MGDLWHSIWEVCGSIPGPLRLFVLFQSTHHLLNLSAKLSAWNIGMIGWLQWGQRALEKETDFQMLFAKPTLSDAWVHSQATCNEKANEFIATFSCQLSFVSQQPAMSG